MPAQHEQPECSTSPACSSMPNRSCKQVVHSLGQAGSWGAVLCIHPCLQLHSDPGPLGQTALGPGDETMGEAASLWSDTRWTVHFNQIPDTRQSGRFEGPCVRARDAAATPPTYGKPVLGRGRVSVPPRRRLRRWRAAAGTRRRRPPAGGGLEAARSRRVPSSRLPCARTPPPPGAGGHAGTGAS